MADGCHEGWWNAAGTQGNRDFFRICEIFFRTAYRVPSSQLFQRFPSEALAAFSVVFLAQFRFAKADRSLAALAPLLPERNDRGDFVPRQRLACCLSGVRCVFPPSFLGNCCF